MKKRLLKILKRTFIVIFSLAAIGCIITYFYMKHPKFGKAASGARLERMKKSPNYKDGKFQNLSFTPELTEGYSMAGVTYEFLFKRTKRRKPSDTIPTLKTDLHKLPADSNLLVWFGHSSYYMQVDGKKILVDPVFSGNASPLGGTNKAFPGTDQYSVNDLPEIDYLFISHDHYDHLDYETIVQLKGKVKKIFCGLGVGAHLEYWGYDASKIEEHDWYESVSPDPGFTISFTPARHFSGRGLTRNTTLWTSFVFKTPSMNLFIGGDSGYDTHFAAIGEKYGPFDLAILENGQYDIKWKYIHTLPEELIKVAKELKAKMVFPVHSSKFAMANHAWDEPLIKAAENAAKENIPLVTPVIGEVVRLGDSTQQFRQWWAGMK